MSDADDQMGGSRERPAHDDDAEKGKAEKGKKEPPDPDQESEQSFPASDPPGNY